MKRIWRVRKLKRILRQLFPFYVRTISASDITAEPLFIHIFTPYLGNTRKRVKYKDLKYHHASDTRSNL